VTVAVHTHNDLGMATATTVESFFAGATQLECALNGLGERAGNTNLYEVAVAIHNCGVERPLNMHEIYETALQVSEWSRVPIYEKAPLVGADVVAHRSGIHQDGAAKTRGMKKNADGSYDVYFAPVAPKGKDGNWVQTVPGKSWFTILRMYGPLEPWINKTWRPSEIELVK
jgi:isopropylmalate/homocitrate/citramalate synthase